MIWFLESHSFLVAVSASFLFGILLDMLLKKLTGSEKIGYVAVTAAAVTAVFIGAYGTTLHALACILTGQVLLFAAEYDFATHTVPDYVPVLILMTGLLEVEFAPALLGLVLVPLPFVVAALVKEGSIGDGVCKERGQRICNGAVSGIGMPACHATCITNFDKNGGKKSEKFIEEPYCDWTDLYHPFADHLLRSYPDVQQCTEIEGIPGPCEYGDPQRRPDYGEDAYYRGSRWL